MQNRLVKIETSLFYLERPCRILATSNVSLETSNVILDKCNVMLEKYDVALEKQDVIH